MQRIERCAFAIGVALMLGCGGDGGPGRGAAPSTKPRTTCEIGDACDECTCKAPNRCDADQVCEPRVEEGEACQTSADCRQGRCFEQICRATPKLGEACDACSGCPCWGEGEVGVCTSACRVQLDEFGLVRVGDSCTKGFCHEEACWPTCDQSEPAECSAMMGKCENVTGLMRGYGICRKPSAKLLKDMTACPLTRDGLAPGDVTPSTGLDASAGARDGGADAGRADAAVSSRRFVAIQTTNFRSCALRDDNALVCWGSPLRQSFASERLTVFEDGVALCGVRPGGALVCVSTLSDFALMYGLGSVPSGTFRTMSLADTFACALDTAGGVRCWGEGRPVFPAGKYSAIATNFDGACALAMDGTIRCVRKEGLAKMPVSISAAPSGTFIDIDGDRNTFCAVSTEGVGTCWGLTGELSTPPPELRFKTIRVEGFGGACGITTSGGIDCFGGLLAYKLPEGEFTTLSVDHGHGCALDVAGRAHCWASSPAPGSQVMSAIDPPLP